jgi:UDP-3-O-[3-hydroxymyristoyl] N-acetylglucosamine deacetylase
MLYGVVMLQATLDSRVRIEGIGVHSGSLCEVSVIPAPENSGIVFLAKNKREDCIIKASHRHLEEVPMCTKLSNGIDFSVSTVEHLLAALYGVGISNAIIQIRGIEIPLLDGSAQPFIDKFLAVGIKQQSRKRKALRIYKTIKVQNDVGWASLSPSSSDSFSIRIECDYTKYGLQTEPLSFDFATDDFLSEIAPARTFGFLADAELLKKNNLARGATVNNTIIFGSYGSPINDKKLKFPDEPVRHKILDIVGDMVLAEYIIFGKLDAFCPSHKINHMLLKALFETPYCYDQVL